MAERWNKERDGEFTEQKLKDKLKSLGYSVSRYVYHPGTVFPPHTHSVDKIDGVVSGQFEMEMNGQRLVLTAGDTLAVPKNTLHSAKVVGSLPVVSLDAVKN